MIFLFTDFGAADIYVGQMKAVLHERAPKAPVVDLLNDAPPFNVRAGAHLLAAFAARLQGQRHAGSDRPGRGRAARTGGGDRRRSLVRGS